ncbi:MAG: hypothetical protein S4CHLAM7_00190 [Chlamydiae bacterium]|nr:hypothetical protein [Chlamydiota bacterium]
MKSYFFLLPLFSFAILSGAETTPPTTTSSSQTQNSTLNLKTQMTAKEQKQVGLNKLSPNQVKALESWLNKRSAAQNPSQKPQINPNQLEMVLSEGNFIKLGSGEVWSISPNAWLFTYHWQEGDPIKVGKSGDVLFPISLTNENSGQSVNAKKPSSSVTKAFTQSYTITQVLDDGKLIELNNGSSWEVEPSARYMVQGWSVGNSVFIVKRENSTGAPYQLYNGQTSRSVFVEQKSPPTPEQKQQPTTQANASQNSSQKSQS